MKKTFTLDTFVSTFIPKECYALVPYRFPISFTINDSDSNTETTESPINTSSSENIIEEEEIIDS